MTSAIPQLELLREVDRVGAATVVDILTTFGVTNDTAYRSLEKLVSPRHGGLLERTREKSGASHPYKYSLTTEGVARLAAAAAHDPATEAGYLVPIETSDPGDDDDWAAVEVLVTVLRPRPSEHEPPNSKRVSFRSVLRREHLLRDVFRALFRLY